jgi:branched-chain amino acid transport system permease protein
MEDMTRLAVVGLVAALTILPLGLPTYQVSVATQILIFGMLAMSIDMLAGFAGRTSLGHGAIFGSATYIVIWSMTQAGLPLLGALALGVLGATALAALFALLAAISCC